MFFTEDDKRRITQAADGRLLEVAQDFRELRRSGQSYVCDCPKCGAARKFSLHPDKEMFGCWSCKEVNGKGSLSYLMKAEGKDYVGALDYLARRFNVLLDPKPEPKPRRQPAKPMKPQSREAKGEQTDTFCARMLQASGLTYEDVTARIYRSDDTSAIFEVKTFHPGTVDSAGAVVKGDDAVIEYYDLDGMPVTYYRRDGRGRVQGEKKAYCRVRWQFPDDHLDKNGKPYKYKSPAGSGTPVYIPERMRRLFKEKQQIGRLYIQEGEKKAEKACKHGIPSIAVSGIQNLGMNGSLPEDVVRIITTCGVREVCFIFDSDWQDLSSNIKISDPVEKRPRSFYYAAKNFRDYMLALKNRNLSVEIFVAAIRKNEAGDKGVDDLLANSLQGREEELAKDLDFAANDKKGQGQWVQMYRVSGFSDRKLMELWQLHSHEAFAKAHKDILAGMPEFVFGRYRWRFDEDGAIVLAQPFDDDEKFWTEVEKCDRAGNTRTEYQYSYVNAKNFLQNRGFGRLRRLDDTYDFVRIEPPVVRKIDPLEARDYMVQFAECNCCREVNEMLLKGQAQFVGPMQLSSLRFVEPNFIDPSRDGQYLYFEKSCWHVTRDSVTELGYEAIPHHIWAVQKKDVQARYLGAPLVTFSQDGEGNLSYSISKQGEDCHYLQFLVNTSNFSWRKQPEEVSEEDTRENATHLLSKLCAVGYMAMEVKDNNVARAVIGMDGKQSEVGESNGRSGKSLVGELMRHVVPTAYVPGKRSDLFNDAFVWNDVQENTRLVFIDDVLQNFNFEFLFPNITGDWTINYKGGRRITVPFRQSAKIYIATNHAIRGTGSSFSDRQWLLAFSDYYNDRHKPADDFGALFFSEWDYEQWNLTWNLVACCIQLYLQFGVVQAPGDRLEQRKLRQEITETVISWADEYFSDPSHINARISRKELWDSLLNYDPAQRKYLTPTTFKKKFMAYCSWKGYTFNPHKYDKVTGLPLQYDRDGRPVTDDKSGGVEYFTVGNADFDPVKATEAQAVPFQPADNNEMLAF